MTKAINAVILKNMPFDRVNTATNQFVHATGREIIFYNGLTEVEYEDYTYGDLPEVYEEDEEDEDE